MITERMTLQEVESELLTDSENVYNYMETLMKKFRRLVIKSSKFPVCVDKLYTSKRKNKWIIILKASSKKDVGELTRGFAVCYYNSNHGYYAAVLNPKAITIHTPHFFSRYALRKELSIHGIDLMIHYFRNNTHFVSCIEEITNPDGSKQKLIECSSEEGIMLGLRPTETIFLAKTFITREMAKGEQVELFALYENWRKEIFQKGYLEEDL